MVFDATVNRDRDSISASPTLKRRSANTGEAPSDVSTSTQRELESALRWAKLGQPEWASWPMSRRFAALERAAKAMLRDRSTVLSLAKEEMGKHAVEGLFTEALGPLETLKAWRRLLERAQTRAVGLSPLSFPKKSARIDLVPRGVVGILAPWNYPVAGLYRSVYPALLCGNAVLVKPSEYTPRTSSWFITHLANELPLGVAQAVLGDGRVGAALLEAGVDACVFTGSTRAGVQVRTRCAELGITSSIEMGGKDAALVLSDCALPRTVAGITQWALSNSGQSCGAIEIAYVEEDIADDLVDRLTRSWSQLRTGPGPDDVDVHPVANSKQLELIEAHVADALRKGARLACGGTRTMRGLGYPPTLLDHCNESMDVVREETFGPVLAIVRIRGSEEAVRQINAGKYGLGASIWTRDEARAQRIARRLEVGIVNINNHSFTGAIPALPWSGTRATGYGVANSEWSLLTFCRPKVLVVDRGSNPDPYWMPFDRDLRDLGEALVHAQLGNVLRALSLPRLMRRRVRRISHFFAGR
ncbi:MAG TPA: aldehyde dehydrogenase family protein [Polyangiaceae bacterium]|nr:aldehyde dehydrogenase family protein [Polyangiaceae bacterium]